VSGAIGGVGSDVASFESVVNYNTGEISGFASGGVGVGWNGGAQGSVNGGFIFNLGDSNASYKGPFTNGSASVGPVGIFTGLSSGGLNNPVDFNFGGPNVVGVSAGLSVIDAFPIGGGSVTYYTEPVPMGNIFSNPSATSVLDYVMYAARQVCR
jgi:hypothetical protein